MQLLQNETKELLYIAIITMANVIATHAFMVYGKFYVTTTKS